MYDGSVIINFISFKRGEREKETVVDVNVNDNLHPLLTTNFIYIQKQKDITKEKNM